MSNHQFQSKTAGIISDFGTSLWIVGQTGKRINVQTGKIRTAQSEASPPAPQYRQNSTRLECRFSLPFPQKLRIPEFCCVVCLFRRTQSDQG
jgi:hypothetical protein